MGLTIPGKLLSATTSDQTFTFTGSWLSVLLYNSDATNAVQVEFDGTVTTDSHYIPAGETRTFNIGVYSQTGKSITKPAGFNYKAVSGTANLRVSYITQ